MASESINWQRPAAAIAVLALLAGIWYFEVEFPPANPPPPRFDGPPLVPLAALVPAIGPFEQFNVNPDNPFVPWQDRENEKAAEIIKTTRVSTAWRPPAKPVELDTPKVDPPTLPKINEGGGDAPKPIGMIQRAGGQPVVTVQLPDGSKKDLVPGQSLGRWTLVDIDGTTVALFRDQRGLVHRFRIGSGAPEAGSVPVEAPAPDASRKPPAGAPPGARAPGSLPAGMPFRSLAEAAKALNVPEAQLRQLMQQWAQGGNLSAPARALGVDEATLKQAIRAFQQQQQGGGGRPQGERRGR